MGWPLGSYADIKFFKNIFWSWTVTFLPWKAISSQLREFLNPANDTTATLSSNHARSKRNLNEPDSIQWLGYGYISCKKNTLDVLFQKSNFRTLVIPFIWKNMGQKTTLLKKSSNNWFTKTKNHLEKYSRERKARAGRLEVVGGGVPTNREVRKLVR